MTAVSRQDYAERLGQLKGAIGEAIRPDGWASIVETRGEKLVTNIK